MGEEPGRRRETCIGETLRLEHVGRRQVNPHLPLQEQTGRCVGYSSNQSYPAHLASLLRSVNKHMEEIGLPFTSLHTAFYYQVFYDPA